MENISEINQEKLFDLIESKDFVSLDLLEKEFVLKFISKSEFIFQRKIIEESRNLFINDLEPLPLKLAKEVKVKTIPLYQAILAIAAVFLGFLIIWPKDDDFREKAIEISAKNVDSLKNEIVHDTIIKYVTKTKYVEIIKTEKSVEYVAQMQKQNANDPKLLEVSSSFILPDLTDGNSFSKTFNSEQDNSRFILPINPFAL